MWLSTRESTIWVVVALAPRSLFWVFLQFPWVFRIFWGFGICPSLHIAQFATFRMVGMWPGRLDLDTGVTRNISFNASMKTNQSNALGRPLVGGWILLPSFLPSLLVCCQTNHFIPAAEAKNKATCPLRGMVRECFYKEGRLAAATRASTDSCVGVAYSQTPLSMLKALMPRCTR